MLFVDFGAPAWPGWVQLGPAGLQNGLLMRLTFDLGIHSTHCCTVFLEMEVITETSEEGQSVISVTQDACSFTDGVTLCRPRGLAELLRL